MKTVLMTAAVLAAALPAAAQADEARLDEVVVTGTRRSDVTASDALQGVDVVTGERLRAQAAVTLTDALRTTILSFNAQQYVQQDGSAFVRPFSLRGLAADQTLALVNGKRRHRAALVQITNIPLGNGAQGADLSAIPAIAIDRIEVLRDGSAAQYGSDAIAGVVNFRLRREREGATVTARYGQYWAGDGENVTLAGNLGLPLGAEGFVNISAEYVDSNPTHREAQRPDAQALIDAGVMGVPTPAQRWGNVELEAERVFVNAELPVGEAGVAYLFGGASNAIGETAFGFRSPDVRADIFASVPLTSQPGGPRFSFRSKFPGGFTPMFGTRVRDLNATVGFKGALTPDLDYDLSAATSAAEVQYRIRNTLNPSLGPDSPTSFRPGTVQQRENRLNADFTWRLAAPALASPVTVAFGAEFRRETFEIQAGEAASYTAGPFARVFDPDANRFVGLAVASSGFPGYTPQSAGTFSRDSDAAYIDLEADVTERLSVGGALRYERYEGFGDTLDGKFAARFELADWIAVRGAVSTGFRAPAPGQANISDLATNINLATGGLLLTATRPPDDPIAQFYGAKALKPESSTNYTAGVVLDLPQGYSLTVDAFRIDIDDRITLTSRIPISAADRAAMMARGIDPGAIQTVRFFGNFFDSRTQGFDAVLAKRFDLDVATVNLNASVNYTRNRVTELREPRAVDRERGIEIQRFNPRWRGVISGDVRRGAWSVLARANYYGRWTDAVANAVPTVNAFDQTFGAEWLFDVRVDYELNPRVTLSVGSDNVFNNYPDRDRRPGQRNLGIVYPELSPYGFSGGSWYVAATARW